MREADDRRFGRGCAGEQCGHVLPLHEVLPRAEGLGGRRIGGAQRELHGVDDASGSWRRVRWHGAAAPWCHREHKLGCWPHDLPATLPVLRREVLHRDVLEGSEGGARGLQHPRAGAGTPLRGHEVGEDQEDLVDRAEPRSLCSQRRGTHRLRGLGVAVLEPRAAALVVEEAARVGEHHDRPQDASEHPEGRHEEGSAAGGGEQEGPVSVDGLRRRRPDTRLCRLPGRSCSRSSSREFEVLLVFRVQTKPSADRCVQKWHIDAKLSFESCIGVPSFA
mmetsp:Transcript_23020/g.64738  ORF Transcript_23020/g.64738 Transcript_23020/m.64738 type:complete len:277 (+) Transcript_23020:424-1254(+)